MKILKFFMVALIGSAILSCSKEQVSTPSLMDFSNMEISKDGINNLYEQYASKTNKPIKGELIDAKIGAHLDFLNLKSAIDSNNIVVLNLIADSGQNVKIYSAPSLNVPGQVIVFTVIDGLLMDEVQFTFFNDSDGYTRFSTSIISSTSGKTSGLSNWGKCMQGFFADPFIGTLVQVAGVAGGLGCVPCAGVAGFYTGIAALGCLG